MNKYERNNFRRRYVTTRRQFCTHKPYANSCRCRLCQIFVITDCIHKLPRTFTNKVWQLFRENKTYQQGTTSYLVFELVAQRVWLRVSNSTHLAHFLVQTDVRLRSQTQELTLNEKYDRKKWRACLHAIKKDQKQSGEALFLRLNTAIGGSWFATYKPWQTPNQHNVGALRGRRTLRV